MRIFILFILVYLNTSFTFVGENIVPAEIIPQMLDEIKGIKTMKYTLKNTERINGKLLSGIQNIKYKATPRKCYLYLKSPNEGSEVLFVEGQNNNQAIYNPNGFPYFRLRLDPMGSLMRKNNHHTVYEVGLGYMGEILSKSFEAKKEQFKYLGNIQWKNKSCYKIAFNNPGFKFISYTVKDNEDVISIAKKFLISEYMIVEINEDVDDYEDVKLNQTILIPNTYAKSIEMYIDQETLLPIFLKIMDSKGLYEQYEYSNLVLNPNIPDEEFAEAYLGKN